MIKKFRIILVLISLSISLCLMSNTYSRYIADTSSNIDVMFSNWQILVNTIDVTNGSSSEISFTPIIDENENIAENTIAPSSTGYFDIAIDPRNTDVSFSYSIALSIENENVPDLMITKYAILPNTYIEGDSLEFTNIIDSTITDTLYFDNNTEDFSFNNFTVRVYFEWFEGETELMDDDSDTAIGLYAATDGETFTMNAAISFEQVIE